MKYNFLIAVISIGLFICCAKTEIKEGELIVDDFYNNIENENYRALDTLMSFQFYQTTPYKEFIEIIKKKKEYLVK